jgi:hypothetical protein
MSKMLCWLFRTLIKVLSFFQVKEILEHVLVEHASKTAKVLLVAANDHEAQKLTSSLKLEICTVPGDSSSTFTICSRCSEFQHIFL